MSGRVRRETGRRLRVKVLYDEGVASRTGPEGIVTLAKNRRFSRGFAPIASSLNR
jgi:hypothetical protein